MFPYLRLWRPALLAGSLLALAIPGRAQHGGGAGGGEGMHGPGGFSGDSGSAFHGGNPSGNNPDTTGSNNPLRGGLQLGPPGRWWDDRHIARQLKLRPEQLRRMDVIFEQNRPTLLRSLQFLEQEQARMDNLLRAPSLDEFGLDTQIDRLSQARADLSKANTHMLLQIRAEMDPDQITRLQQTH